MKMKDIAEELGVSIATISRVINGHNNVNEKTREKVLKFVTENGYTPNVIAQNLSKMENRTIALLVPNLVNPFFATLLNYVCKIFYKNGYQIALYNTLESIEEEKKAILNILSQRISGVIAILQKGEYEKNPLEILSDKGIAVYLLDRDYLEYDYSGVFLDNYMGAYKITKKMIEKGHKDIAILTGNLKFLNARERLRGYIEAHNDCGIKHKEENIYIGDYLEESGYSLGKKILKSGCTALFSSNIMMLYGFLKAQKEEKKDIELGCFEKNELLEILGIEVISCEIPLKKMGEEIGKMFLNKDKNRKVYIEPILY